jgi:hypothetical protein
VVGVGVEGVVAMVVLGRVEDPMEGIDDASDKTFNVQL